MTPRDGFHTPTIARASEDLPEPVGPMTPSAVPAAKLKLTSCKTVAALSGKLKVTAVSLRLFLGGGMGGRFSSAGTALNMSANRRQLCLASPCTFHLPTA